ncbi:Uncharacterised protein [Ectopseudomonas mendocina]|uniref:Uncharacterized protein n=1 Tax=Ectopseudomonas mendocina TaxID=300 RepID=A0A379PLP8_ECTME|nr:hypothetical protein [Pseudomonas mendocina]SUE95880.1 Uncharacterised protein [Pseudomonas mendocina]
MYIYQDIDGKGLSKSEWMKKCHSPDWIVKQFRNEKIWIAVEWVGRYDKKLPAEYRHSHAIVVRNRLSLRKSEWESEEVHDDKGWVIDPTATKTFRTKSAAEAAYEDLLLTYTSSYLDETDDGDMVLVEEGNEFGPKTGPIKFEVDDELLEVAESKGISVGGWS